MEEMDRRSFIKGTAVVAAGVTAASMLTGTAFAADGAGSGSASTSGSTSGAASGSAAASVSGSAVGGASTSGSASGSSSSVSDSSSASGSGSASGTAQGSGQQQDVTEAPDGPVPGYMCTEDWLGEPPTIADSDIKDSYDFDVVILGGGHAGCQAALAAAQEGASVAVIESQTADAYTWFGNDFATYNSKFLQDLGFGPYDLGEITAEFVRRTAGRAKTSIIRSFVENSGEMLDNLVSIVPDTSNVFDFDDKQFIVQVAYDMPDGSYYPLEKSGFKAWASAIQTMNTINPTPVNGRDDLSRMSELETYTMLAAQALGAQWFNGYTASLLVQNDAGDVTGAIAQNADGAYEQFNAAKGVLLATGDFSGNPDMVYNLFSDGNEWGERVSQDRNSMGSFGRDGMGHKLGCWAGGAIEPSPRPAMSTAKGVPGPWGSVPALFLDGDGERYQNEAMAQYIGLQNLRASLGFTTVIMDANFMDSIKSCGIDHGAPNWGYPDQIAQMQADMANVPLDDPAGGDVTQCEVVSRDLTTVDKRTVYASSTLEGLLGLLGFEGDALQKALDTIDHYNELCDSGTDSDFGKDSECLLPIRTAPFYGTRDDLKGTTKATLVTLAGLLTDNNLNVMKFDRSGTIKGLYAAGNCLGQRYGSGYATPTAGNSIGMAMTHGRVAGKIIANL